MQLCLAWPCVFILFFLFTVMIQEAMAKFAPENDAPIPWVRILGYGRSVFDMARLASDLRVKWRNMQKK